MDAAGQYKNYRSGKKLPIIAECCGCLLSNDLPRILLSYEKLRVSVEISGRNSMASQKQ
jgi:hypothetical protein